MTLFHSISDPTLAYLLLSAGLLSIFFEIANPGALVPGVAGTIAVFVGLVSLGHIDSNWVSLLLMGLAYFLFVVDLHAPSHGVLTLAGIASFAVGSFMLDNPPASTGDGISRIAILAVTAIMAGFFLFAVGAVLRTRLTRSTTGKEGMRDAIGVVRESIDPEGYVFVAGELWRARTTMGSIPIGDFVRVLDVDGLTLVVEPETVAPVDSRDTRTPHDSQVIPVHSMSK
jgi:membrane-bound serine protease (ClpP class)